MLCGEASHSKAASQRRQLLGKPVCHHAFRILLGIGSSRFRTLRKSAAAAEPCPVDGRFMRKKFGLEAAQQIMAKRQCAVAFLQELYEQTAEPTPGLAAKTVTGDGFKQFKRQRGRRPHHFLERESRNRAASRCGRSEMRYLPPGSFQDYHELFRAWLLRKGHDAIGLRLFKTASCSKWKSSCLLLLLLLLSLSLSCVYKYSPFIFLL